jgi:uncharacterized Zn finger protein
VGNENLFEMECPKCKTIIKGEVVKDKVLNGEDVIYTCPKCGTTVKHPSDIKIEKVVT